MATGADEITKRLGHRGPDATGRRDFGRCSLGHTRLRILDLSPLGDQPLPDEDGGVWAVFNGEIYNYVELRRELKAAGHQFKSDTDTEVLVHLYEEHGEAMAQRLRGMFAFAIWDERRQQLMLCRDRLGIKPLYYRMEAGRLSFASEVQALAEPSAAINNAALHSYLRLGWVGGPRTIRAGICELLPGHILTWDGNRSVPIRFASPFGGHQDLPPTTEELAEALVDAMRRHLVSDVPVGLFLSSGVDSAVIARIASPIAPNLQTYTVAFESSADESPAAATLARHLGLPHTVVPVGGMEASTSIERFVDDMDQPTVDGLNSWFISRAVRDAGAVVALSGLGGDELFSGYSTFRHVPRLALAGRVMGVGRQWGPTAVGVMGWSARTAHSRVRRATEAVAGGGLPSAYASVRGLFGDSELNAIWPAGRDLREEFVTMSPDEGRCDAAVVGQLEMTNYLPFQLLRDTDCMSMAHALEVRVPLLDDAVVDVAWRGQCLAADWNKNRLIDAVDPNLRYLAQRPKRTFTLPIDDWMRGRLRNTVEEGLVALGETDLGFDRRGLTNLWLEYHAGRTGWRPVWALAVLGMWVDRSTRESKVPLLLSHAP